MVAVFAAVDEKADLANAGVDTILVLAISVKVATTLVSDVEDFILVISEVLKDDIAGREIFMLFGSTAILPAKDVAVTIDVLVKAEANVVVGFNISELIGRVTVVK